jgi:UDP-N-acetylmuramoyl-L-alanyl-D-glutamate--2,6-diaminopimelate ligase
MMAAKKTQPAQITLKQLLTGFVTHNYLPDVPVTGLTLDSRQVQPGNIFVALEGAKEHGLAYAHAAVNKGAVAVLCDRQFDQYCQQMLSALMTRVVCVPVANLRDKLGAIASGFYNAPSNDLFMVGITGTDGKTSVSHFVAQALQEAKLPSAVIGTIGNGLLNQLQTATHTTPNVIEVHGLLAQLRDAGATQVTMEVSSHGLHQKRVDGVDFDVAVLTNLGRDHLDYHGDVEAYREAKRLLFLRPELRAAVLNLDDVFGRQLATELQDRVDIWGYSLHQPVNLDDVKMLHGSKVRAHAGGLDMHIQCAQGEADVRLNVLGTFNASNVLATLAVLLIRGVHFDEAVRRLQALKTVPGRMETCRVKNKPLAVIDYAHTAQALTSALSSLRAHCAGKLICVFGCGGDRDRGKRPLMAAAAEQLADVVIVTDDNPRTENPQTISDEIFSGFNNSSVVTLIHDREQAIRHALTQAGTDDIVLIAGKGHEDYQIIGTEKRPFSDMQVVKNCFGGAA